MKTLATILTIAVTCTVSAREYHVATTGNDSSPGSQAEPFKTISAAANVAQPGDTITVHAGIYRERVTPPRGGTSDKQRITYQAAPGEKVEIKGSEAVTGWANVEGDVWKVTLPNSFFGKFNPYSDRIRGDWFKPKDREHHTGAVYLNDEWLTEAAKLDDVMKPVGGTPFWFGKVDDGNTTIWAQFKGVNPNDANVEINVRPTVFTPARTGINYITVRGFKLRNAATNWAPPTAGQIGLITAYWCKGWIIEGNDIGYSTCSGVALGKYGDEWDNRAESATGYVGTITRALTNGWNKATVGHHIVRDNHISHCEQTGIVGSLGCSFSTVTGNVIHDIHVRQLFDGAEMAGIKFHGAIDTEISHNHIYRTNRGIWLDWMAQGTRVSGNLLHDNHTNEDLFMEVNHGPYLVDNNIFLSRINILDLSEGGAFVHNLFTGKTVTLPVHGRETPFHPPHSTEVAGLRNIMGGDNRFYNNIFVGDDTTGAKSVKNVRRKKTSRVEGYGLWVYDRQAASLQTGGNVLFNGAKAYAKETNPLVLTGRDPGVTLVQQDGQFRLKSNFGEGLKRAGTVPVTTALLGKAKIPDAVYENPDGTPVRIDTDYFGNPRDTTNPFPGPFEVPVNGTIKVWPKQ